MNEAPSPDFFCIGPCDQIRYVGPLTDPDYSRICQKLRKLNEFFGDTYIDSSCKYAINIAEFAFPTSSAINVVIKANLQDPDLLRFTLALSQAYAIEKVFGLDEKIVIPSRTFSACRGIDEKKMQFEFAALLGLQAGQGLKISERIYVVMASAVHVAFGDQVSSGLLDRLLSEVIEPMNDQKNQLLRIMRKFLSH